MIYMSLAEALAQKYLGTTVYKDAWPLDDLSAALKDLRQKAAA